MVWLYVPGLECLKRASEPDSNYLESSTKPFVTSSGKPMRPRSLLRSWRQNAWMRHLSGLTFSPSTASRGVEKWISLLPGSHARTCLSQVVGQDSTATGQGFSSMSCESQKIAVRDCSFWRTSEASLLPKPPLWTAPKNCKSGQRPESWGKWPTAGGIRNGCMYQRPTWAEATSGRGGSALRGGNWPTADCNTSTYSNGKRGQNLRERVQNWPTPNAQDSEQAGGKGCISRGNRGHTLSSLSLPQAPQTRDGQKSSSETPTSRRRLNPAFAAWLMTWPWWWTNPGVTNCAASEMESYRHRLRQHLWNLLGDACNQKRT